MKLFVDCRFKKQVPLIRLNTATFFKFKVDSYLFFWYSYKLWYSRVSNPGLSPKVLSFATLNGTK